MDTKSVIRWTILAALFFAGGSQALAASQADMDVAVRSLGFISGIGGVQTVLVIYDPANAASRADAESAAAALSNAKGKVSFRPVLTAAGNMEGGKLAYISGGMNAHFGAIRSAAAARGILTFTHDKDCVDARVCAIYVAATPNVVIEVSQSAMAATPFELAAALKMMVKEVP